MIVYLVGMPGSGKSTVGPELARRLGVPFVELDERIEHAAGSSVREIFERDGEARFRELEAAALVEAASRDPSVVSCGGGVVLEPANRVSLRATGEVVFLSVPLEVLAERVRPGAERPLIRSEGDLERLYRDREPLYREFAAHVVDATGPFQLYGDDARKPGTFAANCLLARRLAEKGVRFIQLYHRGWDQHTNLPKQIEAQCKDTDQPTAGLVAS